MIKLTPRLMKIAECVPEKSQLADVGTDHAYIPAWLVQNGFVDYAWATDLQIGPLENAKKTVTDEGLEDKITLKLGGGLTPLRGEAPETIVIAGMGGILISEILQNDMEIASRAKRLILQPMVGQMELRKWLVTNGFNIVHECLAKEGHKFYEIIVAVYGTGQQQDDLFDVIGYKLPFEKDPLFPSFLDTIIHRYKKIVKESSKSNRVLEIRAVYESLLKRMEAYKHANEFE